MVHRISRSRYQYNIAYNIMSSVVGGAVGRRRSSEGVGKFNMWRSDIMDKFVCDDHTIIPVSVCQLSSIVSEVKYHFVSRGMRQPKVGFGTAE